MPGRLPIVFVLWVAATACQGPAQPELGLGRFCSDAHECLAGRDCVEPVAGRARVCGETCRTDADDCASPAYPDAFCHAAGVARTGVCTVPCTLDENCPGDLVCGPAGRCVPPGPDWVRVAGPLGPATTKVDLLVLVDDSGTMAEEQGALGDSFGTLLELLLEPPDVDGDATPDYSAVEDLNVGVISSDMGTAGFPVRGCSEPAAGDDGCLRSDPGPGLPACADDYPRFLSRNPANAGMYAIDQLEADFACVAQLGVAGCGFEQSLAAVRKALTVGAGSGGCNEFFLRPDSILVLLIVTDEDDCSVRPDHPEFFDQEAELGELAVRCFLHPELLEEPTAFHAAFTALRSTTPDRLIVGLIAGVPPDVGACQGAGDELEGCLDEPEMIEQLEPGGRELVPSCNTVMGRATPPRRLAELAVLFGDRAEVGSICAIDWTLMMERLAERVSTALPGGCFAEDLPFDVTTCRTSCRVLEVLSDDRPCAPDPSCECAYGGCTDPRTREPCEPLRRDGGTIEDRGATRRACILRQTTRTPERGRCSEPANEGWTFVPQVMSPVLCPVLRLDPGGVSLLEEGSVAYVECGPPA